MQDFFSQIILLRVLGRAPIMQENNLFYFESLISFAMISEKPNSFQETQLFHL